MKKALQSILVVAVPVAVFWAYMVFSPDRRINPISFIPSDAIYILETKDPVTNWDKFSGSSFWTVLKSHKELHDLTEDANYLDSLINSNRRLLKYFGDRSFVLSAHMTLNRDYDFLFAFDLRRISKLNLIPLLMDNVVNKEDFTLTQRPYKSHTIIEIKDNETKDFLYISQIQNYLVCSYNSEILEKSLSQYEDAEIAGNLKFQEAYKEINEKGIGRFYIQYAFLDEFMRVYIKDPGGVISELSKSFAFSAFDLKLGENEINISGYSTIPDSGNGYMDLVLKHGNSAITFDRVLSNRTAYAQSISLNNFRSFYKELLALRKGSDEYGEKLKALSEDLQKNLNLSLEDDLLAWIGNEVVTAYNVPNKLNYSENDLVVAVKARSKSLAEEKLDKIQKQIKKKTPARFKTMSYKGYGIHYLELKGFFQLFFGKAFAKITKPYYTVLEDFVIFSNSPKTLVALLEDYENGQTLNAYAPFKGVKGQMPKKNAFFTYVNGPLAYSVLLEFVIPEKRKVYIENRRYFNFFKSIGIAFSAHRSGFKNELFLHFNEDKVDLPSALIDLDSVYQHYFLDLQEDLARMSDPERFILEKVDKGIYYRYYPDKHTIHIKAETKNGTLHGNYLEYYRNGTVKVKGKYRKGRKSGIWKYYNKTGEVQEREWLFM